MERENLEREPQLKVVGVMTCRGEIFTHVVFRAKDGDIALVQCQIANTHDTLVHTKSEPCHKRFFTRP